MDKPWKVIAAFVAVFMAGAIFGGLFTLRASGKRFGDWRANEKPATVVLPGPTPTAPADAGSPKAAVVSTQPASATPAPKAPLPLQPALMQQFTRKLKLTPTQRDRIRPIVGRASEDLQRLRQESETDRQRNLADTVRVTDRMYTDVSALLSPDQREELETMRVQMQQRVEKDRKRRLEMQAEVDAKIKAEKAAADADAKNVPATSTIVPTAKPAEKGK